MQFQLSSLGIEVSNLTSVFPVPLAPVSKGRSLFYIYLPMPDVRTMCHLWYHACLTQDQFSFPLNEDFFVYYGVCVYVCEHLSWCVCAYMCAHVHSFSVGQWITLGASSFFIHVASGDQTQVMSLNDKYSYMLSHLTGSRYIGGFFPFFFF